MYFFAESCQKPFRQHINYCCSAKNALLVTNICTFFVKNEKYLKKTKNFFFPLDKPNIFDTIYVSNLIKY